MSAIDHFDIVTGSARSSVSLRKERWPHRLLSFVHWLEGRFAKYRSRKQLVSLEDHLLDDIGISRDAAERELRKGFFN